MNLPYLTHNGVTVYHTYKDDDPQERLLTYWFTCLEYGGQEDSFDVRELLGINAADEPELRRELDAWRTDTICRAIDRGELPGQPSATMHLVLCPHNS